MTSFLHELETIISQRKDASPETSYTARLFKNGLDRILKKIGEEASEVIIAAKNRSKKELSHEAADLIFHLMVLLQYQGLSVDEIMRILKERNR